MLKGFDNWKKACEYFIQHEKSREAVLNYRVLIDVLAEINREGKDEYAAKGGGFLNQLDIYYGLRLIFSN